MIALREPYRTRPVRSLGLLSFAGWRLKVYGIAYAAPAPSAGVVRVAQRIARRCVDEIPAEREPYRLGFVGVHAGRGENFVFVDWWARENELHHRVFTARGTALADFVERTAGGPSACVWDLAVIAFERDAWLDAVLRNPAGPDVERYLATRLDADI